MTPSDVITEVRNLIQDNTATFRYSDVVLLGFVNQTLKKMVVLRPDLFSFITDFTTVADTTLQSCPTDSVRLMQIFQVTDGDAVTEVSKETLDRMYPNWVSESSGTPINFMRHVRNPNKFFVYPRPISGIELVGEYAQSPITYGLNDTILLLPDAYLTSVVEGTVFLAESVDNEHVNSGRAKLFLDVFVQGLGAGLQTRIITDVEEGGLDPRQVI